MSQKPVPVGSTLIAEAAEKKTSGAADTRPRLFVSALCRAVKYVKDNYYILTLVLLLVVSIMLVAYLEN